MATEYEDKFRAAELPEKLDQAEELLGSLSEDQAKTLQENYPNQVPRVRAVILALRPRIGASDPLVLTEQTLAQTNEPLTNLTNALEAYRDSSDIGHMEPLVQWTESLISAVPLWPAGPDLPETDASKIAARFRRSAGQQLRALSGDFEKVKEEVTAFQQDLENRAGQWSEQKTNLETQLNELSSTIDQQRGRLDQAIENYQGQFSEAQERRSEEYRQQLSELEARATELEEQFRGGYDQAIRGAQEKTKKTLDDLSAELVKAQEITSFVGGTSTAAGYGKEASAQKKIADNLRRLAIFFGLLAAGLAVWAVIHAERSSNPSLTVVLAKAVGSLVFAGLAGYVATQSGHHRAREEQARRRELDLLALPAFIATLSDDEKEEITGQVATNLFLAQTPLTGKPEAALTKESIGLIGLLLDAIRKG
jgi:gas vesicle protein